MWRFEFQDLRPRSRKLLALGIFIVVGSLLVFRALHPDPRDVQAIHDIRFDPVTSMAGAITPAFIIALVAYLFLEWLSRRSSKEPGSVGETE